MATLFRRSNGKYYIVYEDAGKRKWKSTGVSRQKDAIDQLLSFEASRSPQQAISPTPSASTTLGAFINDFIPYAKVTFSPRTVEIYVRTFERLLTFAGDRPLQSITPRDGDTFRTQRIGAVSAISVNIEIRTLRAAFATAMRWKLITENPWKSVAMVRIPDQQPLYMSKDDFTRFFSSIREPWLKDLILVAVLTGLRRGELLNLQWKDVDFGNRLIHVQSSVFFKTKGGKRRAIPMNEMVFNVLWRRAQCNVDQRVFLFKGRAIRGDFIVHKFKRYVREAGLNTKLHFHSLRHTFATWLVQEGISIYEVQKLLGHSNITVTQVYAHLVPQELHRAVDKIAVVLN